MEEWKDIKGYEGHYQVSNLGRVKSFKLKTPNILRPYCNGGYYSCDLILNNNISKNLIHRLVAGAFIPNPENKTQVNHKDGNKQNNYVGNLEWCTASENMKHAYFNKLNIQPKGSNKINSKLSEKDVIEIRDKYIPYKYSYKKLGDEYGVHESTIREIIYNTNWKHI